MVYIDTMNARYSRMRLCHMIADSGDELLAMADRIGLARQWLQKPGTVREHFDICLSKKKLALAAGAREVNAPQLIVVLRSRSSYVPTVIGDAGGGSHE